MLMSVSADGDLSNIDPASLLPCASGPIPDSRFVPFDNNIAQRNVAPVAGGGGGDALSHSLQGKQFWVNNPFNRTVRISLEFQVPPFLKRRGWSFSVRSAEGASSTFSLAARTLRHFTINVHEGETFAPADVPVGDSIIRIVTLADGVIIGGMSYAVDSELKHPPAEQGSMPSSPGSPGYPGEEVAIREASGLLESLGIVVPANLIKSVEATKITLEIDLKRRCH